MSYTENILEAERLALLTGERKEDWYVLITSEGVGVDSD